MATSGAYRRKAASQPTLVEAVATDAAPVEAAAPVAAEEQFPETPNLDLPLIPDDADDWGDDYRRAMETLDAHPGVRAFAEGQRPGTPFGGQVILEQSDPPRLLAYDSTAQEWKPVQAKVAQSYTHTQTTPSTVWTVIHNLGFIPAGLAVRERLADGTYQRSEPDVVTATTSATVLQFSAPSVGDATVS